MRVAPEKVGLRSLYWQGRMFGCLGGAAVAAVLGVYSLTQGEFDTGVIMLGLAAALSILEAVLGFLYRRDDAANARRLNDDATE